MTAIRRCWTPEEYALELKVSTRTVYRLIKSGELKAERIGRQWRICRWITIVSSGQQATRPTETP